MSDNFADDVHWTNNLDKENFGVEPVSSSSMEAAPVQPDISSTTNMDGQPLRPARASMKRPYHFNAHNVHLPAKVPAIGKHPWLLGYAKSSQYSPFGNIQTIPAKHPVSLLNEQYPNIIYKLISVSGPSHCPQFLVSVVVDNTEYKGTGRSKREARSAAALNCLNAQRTSRASMQVPPTTQNHDFASDTDAFNAIRDKENESRASADGRLTNDFLERRPAMEPLKNVQSPKSSSPLYVNVTKSGKSPINVLYETFKNVSFECITVHNENTPVVNANQRFKTICTILGESYEGYGSSKKLAKLASARTALAVLNERERNDKAQLFKELQTMRSCDNSRSTVQSDKCDENIPSIPNDDDTTPMANRIGMLVVDKFSELMRANPLYAKRKVLAGIVMTDVEMPDDYQVIGVGTGTKCVNGDYMSTHGLAINDSHAEVVTRRCFMLHLYNQLRMYADASDPRADIKESDLEPYTHGAWVGYRLRPSKRVHLYISTAPCGDSRIFSPHEDQVEEINGTNGPRSVIPSIDKHPNRLARGQLRTKIESGEGTIPVRNANQFIQTWDGVIDGERLLTMSCSDKVARWNILGLQGSLLSLHIYPIYLESVVLGSLLHKQHLTRALYGRLLNNNGNWISPLPPPLPFFPRRPLLHRSSTTAEMRMAARSPVHSIAWTKGLPHAEVVNSVTGMTEAGHASRLCKQAMFSRWMYVTKKLPISSCSVKDLGANKLIYAEAKELATLYQDTKKNLFTAFLNADLGRWVKKPIEQDNFPCRAPNATAEDLFG